MKIKRGQPLVKLACIKLVLGVNSLRIKFEMHSFVPKTGG